MDEHTSLLERYKAQLLKSLQHLEYSFKKVSHLDPVSEMSSEQELESWESFSSRFARSSDLYISKVLRKLILEKDPAFRGSVIDLLHEAEKFHWISSANSWRRIRQLRNVAAHEYAIDDLSALYQELLQLTPILLEAKNVAKS
jgi:hypothetical protein